MKTSPVGPVLGCVVAGGRSSRMGRDKASLVLAGESLLARAVRALSGVCSSVVVSGSVAATALGLPVLADAVPGLGPLGGIVTVLRFAKQEGAAWVMFLPVDMPLLPISLLPVLLERWSEAGRRGARVCCAETDGILQPLISLLHVDTASALEDRLGRGDLRVRPGLEAAAEQVAEENSADGPAVEKTRVGGEDPEGILPVGWRPEAAEWALRPHWFVNANTPEDLLVVEQALRRSRLPQAAAAVSE